MKTFSLPFALAQINATVGDIAGNAQRIVSAWKEASDAGAKLVVFPELAVIGYSPEDLVLTPDFRKKAMQAVQDIAEKTKDGAAIILGCVWEKHVIPNACEESLQSQDKIPHLKVRDDNVFHNAALLIDDGKITHIQPKTRLPNYGVFDEKRVFVSGAGPQVATFRGHKIGILVCEDVWDERLSASLATQGAEMVFVINASPFEVGKSAQRIDIIKRATAASHVPHAYVNLVGGQDDIVFDGGSFVMSAAGDVVAQAVQCEDVLLVIPNVSEGSLQKNNDKIPPRCVRDDNRVIWNILKLGLSDYVRKNGFSGVLLGLSGGIDSAVSAAVAVDALGADNVLGVLLPSPYSSQGSVDDALETAKLLGIKTHTIPISGAMETFSETLAPAMGNGWMEEPAVGGNLQARLRGITLMALSNSTGKLLLSTGNKSEIAVGYSTLYGDACGAYNVLKDLYKTQVYALAHWRNAQSPAIPQNSITKAPSAELKPNQTDQDQLPPYDVLDAILAHHIEGQLSAEEIIAKGFEKATVEKILKLVRINEYKRRQSCPGAKISPMMFGRDRRFPLTNRY